MSASLLKGRTAETCTPLPVAALKSRWRGTRNVIAARLWCAPLKEAYVRKQVGSGSALEGFVARRLGEPRQVLPWVHPELLSQLGQRSGAAVTDGRAQVFQHVVENRPHGSARRNTDLETFRAQGFHF